MGRSNYTPPVRRAADAHFGRNFDPYNSVGAGHQRAENRPPPGWRESRNLKLQSQFAAGRCTSEAGGRGGGRSVHPKRAGAEDSIADMLRRQGAPRTTTTATAASSAGKGEERGKGEEVEGEKEESTGEKKGRGIFDGLVVYINGSTYPAVSDHKLKRVLADNGARLSIHLARRHVTHVILGKPAGSRGGIGGGLAGGKLEKEIRRVGGCGVKYVGVEWVLESVRTGKRLPETRFSNLSLAPRDQQSVYQVFSKRA